MDLIRTAHNSEIQTDSPSYWFIFTKGRILVEKTKNHENRIPLRTLSEIIGFAPKNINILGVYQDKQCFCLELNTHEKMDGPFEFINLRKLYGSVSMDFWSIAGYARQITDFYTNFRYCSKCGSENNPMKNEHAVICSDCGFINYPRIHPAIITAVVKENKILLARGVNFPNKLMYSVLAGFVEPGETLEACVEREIFEESGINVKNINYFGSQPWPFPDSLMIGFTAEYKSGHIIMDTKEIADAGWFNADNLPVVPGRPSIAGELINWFVSKVNV